MEEKQQQQEEVAISIPTIEGTRGIWDVFSRPFSDHWSHLTSCAAYALALHLFAPIQDPDAPETASAHKKGPSLRVLEVGTGAGIGTRTALNLVPVDTTYVATDLSEDFLRIGLLVCLRDALLYICAKDNLAGSTKHIEFAVANAEALPFDTASFDSYIANFVLHLTPEPMNMLKEARRVLKPNGMAGFSVWGRKEFSSHYVSIPVVAKQLGIDLYQGKNPRSSFHLGGDPDALKKMALDAGFTRAFVWYSTNAANVHNAEAWVNSQFRGPLYMRLATELGAERTAEFKAACVRHVQRQLDDGKLLDFETLYLIAWA